MHACCLCVDLAWQIYFSGPLYGVLKFVLHHGLIVSMHAPTKTGKASARCPMPHPPPQRWRGGAKSDPGAATGDASVDLEMYNDQCHAGQVVAIGTHHLQPTACSTWMPLADGRLARAAVTNGDGACSLPALRGALRPQHGSTEYFCADARKSLYDAMPA